MERRAAKKAPHRAQCQNGNGIQENNLAKNSDNMNCDFSYQKNGHKQNRPSMDWFSTRFVLYPNK